MTIHGGSRLNLNNFNQTIQNLNFTQDGGSNGLIGANVITGLGILTVTGSINVTNLVDTTVVPNISGFLT